MRIVFATPSPFPYYAGGVETWMYNVIKRIADNNEIIVLSPSYHTMKRVFTDLPSSVRIVNYQCLRENKLFNLFMHKQLSVVDLLYRQKTFKQMLRQLINESKETTYVFCVDPIFLGPMVAELKTELHNLKFIMSIRGPHLDIISNTYPLFKNRFKANEKQSVTQCDLLLVNGYDSKDLYEKRYNRPAYLQKNGVDISKILNTTSDEAIEINDNENSILSVATLIPVKGVFDLIDAGKVYKEKYGSNFKMYFVGKGNQENLYRYAEHAGIREQVVCLGHRDNPIPYMKKTKINACISGGGGLNMTMLESLASGVPVVAIDTPMYQQFNEFGHLTLVPEKNSELLADCIYKVFNNYKSFVEKTDLSLKIAEKYDWNIVVKDLIDNLKVVE